MGWYERTIFNRVLEASLDSPPVHEERRRALAPAMGEVLEVGIGTGLNLPHYPDSVRRIVAVTLDDALDARAIRRAGDRGIEIDHVRGDGARLPFDEARFDTVVSTFILCSIRDPAAAIAEFRRVLRPGGRLLVLEHVAAKDARARFILQRALTPISVVVNCGCHFTRDTELAIESGGFTFDAIDRHDIASMPLPVRRVIRGVARALGQGP